MIEVVQPGKPAPSMLVWPKRRLETCCCGIFVRMVSFKPEASMDRTLDALLMDESTDPVASAEWTSTSRGGAFLDNQVHIGPSTSAKSIRSI